MDAIVSRLDAIAARQETITDKLSLKDNSNNNNEDVKKENGIEMSSSAERTLRDFQNYMKTTLPPFLELCNKVNGLKRIGEYAKIAWENHLELIKKVGVSKKPSQDDLLSFLKPTSKVVEESSNMDYKSPYYTHQQAFNSSIPVLSYPLLDDGCYDHVEAMVDSGTVYVNKIIMKSKKETGEEAEMSREWAKAYKALLDGLQKFVKDNYKLGIVWNPKGNELVSCSSSATSTTNDTNISQKQDTSVTSPQSTISNTNDGSNKKLFNEQSQGQDITKGLKKVTSDMKTKNQKDNNNNIPIRTERPKQIGTKVDIKGNPIFEMKGANWFVENQQNVNTLEVKDLKMQNAVYIGTSYNIVTKITGKPKSVNLNNCVNTIIYVDNILSTIEITNCERCTIYILKSCPTVAIDKSKGIIINLTSEASTNPPDLVTSNISECNLQVPGDKEDQDILEIPLPEQYLSKFANKSLVTTTIKHG